MRCSMATIGRQELSKSGPTGSLKTSMDPISLSLPPQAFIPQVIQSSIWHNGTALLTTLSSSQDLCIPASHPNLSSQSPRTPRTFWICRDQQLRLLVEICLWETWALSALLPRYELIPPPASLSLSMARFEGLVPTGRNDLARRCCPWARWPIARIWNCRVCQRNRRRTSGEDV